MNAQNLLQFGVKAMARGIRTQQISSAELITAHIRRIEEVNSSLNAVVEPLFDFAMKAARRADEAVSSGEELGPLHGVPVSIKDAIDVQGVRTTAGTLGRKSAPVAAQDATLVARLRQAGAIPIAKTNLPDLLFAFESDNLISGRTSNPYDLTRTAGGSSGGESALIAAGGSPLGLGSDAAGSVRVPAAFCGIASIKPTSGRLPRTGHVPPAGGWIEALWQIGPMARRVEDLQLAMELLSGQDGFDFTCPPAELDAERDLTGLRVACFTENGFAAPEPAIAETVLQAATVLSNAGMQVENAVPPGVEKAYDLEMNLLGADGGEGLDGYVQTLGGHELHPILLNGFLKRIRPRKCSAAGLGSVWAAWDEYRLRMSRFFHAYDAILCPVYTRTALPHGASVEEENFRGFSHTMAWNVAGLPAATVRCGEHDGLPVNVQIVTARWSERLALSICALLESRMGGWKPSPLFDGNKSEGNR